MKFSISACLLTAVTALSVVEARTPQQIHQKFSEKALANLGVNHQKSTAVPTGPHGRKLKYYNRSTKDFWVNGTGIPEVNFEVSESYSGLLPISKAKNETRELFFWFFPTVGGPETENDLVIWLNGGPGCSSLEGFLQENGPISWKSGTFAPVPNPYAWNNLTNMIWVEQPVGTGFSQGVPDIQSEEALAQEFLGFMTNFIDKFGLHHKKIWVTGESYAGRYVPYITDAMYQRKDKRHFDVRGMMIYDPSIAGDVITEQAPAVPFVHYWKDLFALNDTYMATLDQKHQSCGYAEMMEQGLSFPPKGSLQHPKNNGDDCDVWDDIFNAVLLVNPCFNLYEISTTCPVLWDVLGFPGSFFYTPPGADIYFARKDVQDAIHAPHIDWVICSNDDVFVQGKDSSKASTAEVIPRVIEQSERTIIAHGLLDYVLLINGTLMAIQNMTWGGQQGFQQAPSKDFVIPYDDQGVMGQVHTERGLTFMSVNLSGHMVPGFQPSVGYRQLEFLLGRIPEM